MIEQMTLRDCLRALFRQKTVFAVSFCIIMAVVVSGLLMMTPRYEAQVKMLITAAKQTEAIYYRDLGANLRTQETVLTQTQIVSSAPVLERAAMASGLFERPLDYEAGYASALKAFIIKMKAAEHEKHLSGLDQEKRQRLLMRTAVEDLRARVKVSPVRDTNVFLISVTDYNPVNAALLANIVSRSYIIFDLEQQLAELALKYGEKHQAYMQMKDYIETSFKTLTGEPLNNIEAIGPASVKVIEQAQVPLSPVGPKKNLILLLGLSMSLFTAAAAAFAFEYMDQSLKTPREIGSYLNIEFLGSVPLSLNSSRYREVADQLNLMMQSRDFKSVLVTSAVPGEGVTSIVGHLGAYFADALEQKVLIIDAKLKAPKVCIPEERSSGSNKKALELKSEFEEGLFKGINEGPLTDIEGGRLAKRHIADPLNSLDLPAQWNKVCGFQGPGLGEYLEGKSGFEDVIKGASENLFVLPSGSTCMNTTSLLGSARMQELFAKAGERFDLILIDSPTLFASKDTVILSSFAEAVSIVVNEGGARKQVIKAAIEPLLGKNKKFIGVILNNRSYVIPQAIYERI